MKRITAAVVLLLMGTSSAFAQTPCLLGVVPCIAYSASTSISVATTSGAFVAAGAYVHMLQVCTLPASTSNVWLNPTGGTAVVGSGVLVASAGKCVNFGTTGLPMPIGAVTAITDNASAQSVAVTGG